MNLHFRVFIVFLSVLVSTTSPELWAFDPPLVLDPPVVMDVLSTADKPSEIRYLGQVAKAGRIDLTPTNGFFDRCFEALDQQAVISGDEALIGCSFGYLGASSRPQPTTGEESDRQETATQSARWHLWCATAGEIQATFFMKVPADEAEHPWTICIGKETQSLAVQASDGESPQPRTLTFHVRQPGKVTFSIDATKHLPPAGTRIHSIRLEGSAIRDASLLRTRWRPPAVHTAFFAPPECPQPGMWVFESQAVAKVGSYSPITTPFGYFGTSFDKEGRVPAGAGFNFSMWIAGREATQAPPIEQMSRLIGTDLPEAQFSTFGGEGTGVKFRNAVAYQNGADRTIQALRAELNDRLWTFYGYFYDELEQRWRLYASAQQPLKKGGEKATLAHRAAGTLSRTGSFCEIPGPPSRERSGDVVREIKRCGWFLGSDRKWYRAQLSDGSPPKGKVSRPLEGLEQGDPVQLNAKRCDYLDDYPAAGWMTMATGGMECYLPSNLDRRPPTNGDSPAPLPEYLTPEKTAQLFELPVEFGASSASQTAADHATIDYVLTKTGPNSKGVLYYGTVDCLTYPRREVSKGSPAEIDMARPERTWQHAAPEQNVAAGKNQFRLDGLQAGTTYYYRLFVAHDQGKSWDYRSGSFQMK